MGTLQITMVTTFIGQGVHVNESLSFERVLMGSMAALPSKFRPPWCTQPQTSAFAGHCAPLRRPRWC